MMERGVDDGRGPASGWIGRHLAALNTGNRSPLRAVGLGAMPQRSLSGAVPVSALRSIADFHMGGDNSAVSQMQAALTALYAGSEALSVIGQETLAILNTLQALDPLGYTPTRAGHVIPTPNLGWDCARWPCSSRRRWAWRWRPSTLAAGTRISHRAAARGRWQACWPTWARGWPPSTPIY